MRAKAEVRLRAYDLVSRAVAEGVAYGVRRAHKHTETPDEDAVADSVERAVMDALCEVLAFDAGEDT